jgi:hypothetical protein
MKGMAKFRSRFDTSQTIRFQISNWKSGTFYPQATKGLSFKASEPIIDVMQHEPTLSLINVVNGLFVMQLMPQD